MRRRERGVSLPVSTPVSGDAAQRLARRKENPAVSNLARACSGVQERARTKGTKGERGGNKRSEQTNDKGRPAFG